MNKFIDLKMIGTITPNQLKTFGITISIIILIIFYIVFPLVFKAPFKLWPLITVGIIILPTFIYPKILKIIYYPWMILGGILGYINTIIILGIIYYGMFMPIGIFLKLTKKDLLKLKLDKNLYTYKQAPQKFKIGPTPY